MGLINGIDVESSSMVPASVSARDTITWSSDFSVTTEGWQLCFAKPDGGQRTEESSLNAYSALNSSEDFVVYGLAFVGLITILVLLRSTFQKNDYKAIDEASKLKISSAEL